MLRFVCFALFAAVVSAGSLTYKDCAKNQIKSIDVTKCSGASCLVHKGEKLTITVVFTALEDSVKPKSYSTVTIGELEVDAHGLGLDTDACKYVSCPIKKGETKTFKYTITVPSSVPIAHVAPVDFKFKVDLVADNDDYLLCGTFNGSVAMD